MIDDSSGSTNQSARAGLLAPLGRLCARRPWLVIAAVVLVTAVVSPFIARMRIETNLARLLPEDDPGRQATATVDREFGGSDIAVVIVEPGDVFRPQVLEALDSLAGAIAGIPGVTEVQSLTTLQDVSGQGDDVLIRAVVESIPHDAAAMRSLRESVLADKRYRGVLVSADGGSALLVARLAPVNDPAVTARELERVVQASSLGPVSSMAGSAVQMMYVQDWLMSDLVRLLPVVVLVLVLVLALMFRSAYGVLLPLSGVLLALAWTMGLAGACGQQLTLPMALLPPVLVSVGSAYGIHIVERWNHERRQGRSGREAVVTAVGKTGLPVFMATATTAAGFASNAFMPIGAIRGFAIFSSVGVLLSFVLAVTYIPAVLALLPARAGLSRQKAESAGRRVRVLGRVAGGLASRRGLVLAVTGAVVAAGLLLALRVQPQTDFISYFRKGSVPVRAARVVNERFGGAYQFEFVVEGDIADPGLLGRVERFERGLEAVPNVSSVFSVADVVRSTNRAFNSGAAEFDRLPASREEIAQYLFVLSMSGSDFLASYVTPDYQLARISARFGRQESRDIGVAMKAVDSLKREVFLPSDKVSVGGMPMAIFALDRAIQRNQLISIIAAMLAVFLLVAISFRSLRLGLAALLPLALTLAISFGVMGATGTNVDLVTAMLGSIAIGVGIDYSCHLIARYREESETGGPGGAALRAVAGSGPGIVANALAVGLGFAVLALSSLSIIQKFGILVAGTMLLSSAGALLVLPVVLSMRRPRGVGPRSN
ncbi:MAG: MMPL family transporter [bacterium]